MGFKKQNSLKKTENGNFQGFRSLLYVRPTASEVVVFSELSGLYC